MTKTVETSKVETKILCDYISERGSRKRAVKILKAVGRYSICEVNDHNCKGRANVHHIDKNPLNNNINNLLCLCLAHHHIADKYSLNIFQLKNISMTIVCETCGKVIRRIPDKIFMNKHNYCSRICFDLRKHIVESIDGAIIVTHMKHLLKSLAETAIFDTWIRLS